MKQNRNFYSTEEILNELNDTNLGDYKLGDKSINEIFSNIPKLDQVLYSSNKIVLDSNVLKSNSLSCENLFLEYDKNEQLLSSEASNKINEEKYTMQRARTFSSYLIELNFDDEEEKEKEKNQEKDKEKEKKIEKIKQNKNENNIENESRSLADIYELLEDKENLEEENKNKININEDEKIKELEQEKNKKN